VVAGAAAAAELLDDAPPAAALDDVDEVDPHPPSTAADMATTIAPAPMRARLDLNMSATPLSDYLPACRSALNHRRPGEANRSAHLAASGCACKSSPFGSPASQSG
jgi:hypothetical protein